MKISYNWLKDHLPSRLAPEDAARILTDTGLEVEGLEEREAFPGGLAGLVVGQVKEVKAHPGADRLNCTKVDIGTGDLLDIVCGAPNVAEGQKVVVATVGSMLYPSEGEPFKIKKSKIRGEVSLGMLCAEDEIGLGASHEGIMVLDPAAVIGTPMREMVEGEDDYSIEIGLTPNRTDAISHRGVARDLAAWLNKDTPTTILPMDLPQVDKGRGAGRIEIELADDTGCSRYCGVELTDITVGPSPDWLQTRLRAIGLTSINNVVDITNYVMHDMGQPLHAFDADKIGGQKVIVRRAKTGEKFITLDDVERELDSTDLLIADATRGMCLAGVFGGADSGVSESTTTIFLESACFEPVSVRKTAKRHQLSTDSSFRFERGVDAAQTREGLLRAIDLLQKETGAQLLGGIQDLYPKEVTPWSIEVSLKRMRTLMGKDIGTDEIVSILKSLDIEVTEQGEDKWIVSIPTYRLDVTREADVVEEVLRIYGYNNIEIPTKMNMVVSHLDGIDTHAVRNTYSDLLSGAGFTEIMNNSLTASAHADLLTSDESVRVKVLNPLSKELDTMRQTMLWGGLEVISHNRNRKRPDLRLFEFGSVYGRSGADFIETQQLALFMTGDRRSENWDDQLAQSTYYDLKAIVEEVLSKAGTSIEITDGNGSEFAQSAQYMKGERVMASVGAVSSTILNTFDIDVPVFFAVLDMATLFKAIRRQKIAVKPIPKFPVVRRDFSLLIDKTVTFGQIEKAAMKSGGKLLREVGLFDVYEGKNLPDGKVSYAVSFRLLDDNKTLTDKQVDKTMASIQRSLEQELGAQLRG